MPNHFYQFNYFSTLSLILIFFIIVLFGAGISQVYTNIIRQLNIKTMNNIMYFKLLILNLGFIKKEMCHVFVKTISFYKIFTIFEI